MRWFARIFQAVWRPWPPERLEEVRQRLADDRCPHDEQIRFSVEYIANRFLEEGGPIKTQADYERAVRGISEKIKLTELSGVPARKKWVARPEVAIEPDLERRIIAQYRALDSYVEFVPTVWRDIYRDLVVAKENGHAVAVGVTAYTETCPVALTLVKNKSYSIADLLVAYEGQMGIVPILPHPACPRLQADGGDTCRCCWRTKTPQSPEADPTFTRHLDDLLGEHAASPTMDDARAYSRILERQYLEEQIDARRRACLAKMLARSRSDIMSMS